MLRLRVVFDQFITKFATRQFVNLEEVDTNSIERIRKQFWYKDVLNFLRSTLLNDTINEKRQSNKIVWCALRVQQDLKSKDYVGLDLDDVIDNFPRWMNIICK